MAKRKTTKSPRNQRQFQLAHESIASMRFKMDELLELESLSALEVRKLMSVLNNLARAEAAMEDIAYTGAQA